MNKLTKELLKKNNCREEAIFDKNKEIYTNMVVYLRGSELTEYNQEVVREDIIELILDGQQRGDNIQKVMGGRDKEFCDEIIDAMPKKTKKDKVMEFVGTSLNALWILGVIALVRSLIINLISDTSEFNFNLSVGDMISIVVIILVANVIVWFITKTAFNAKKEKKITSFLKTWLITTATFAAIISSSIYLKTIIVSLPLWLATIIVLFIFVMGKIVSEKL